jgi:signal peptidase I
MSAVTGQGDAVRVRAALLDRVLAVLLAAAVAACAAVALALVAGYSPLVVRSGSMAPALHAGDLIFVHTRPASEVAPGDIVTFLDASRGGQVVTHRVVEGAGSGASVSFVTRGDANPTAERWEVGAAEDVRVLAARLPRVGLAVDVLAMRMVRGLGSILVAVGLCVWLVYRIWQPPPVSGGSAGEVSS